VLGSFGYVIRQSIRHWQQRQTLLKIYDASGRQTARHGSQQTLPEIAALSS
jgi:hypothetical protein